MPLVLSTNLDATLEANSPVKNGGQTEDHVLSSWQLAVYHKNKTCFVSAWFIAARHYCIIMVFCFGYIKMLFLCCLSLFLLHVQLTILCKPIAFISESTSTPWC